MKTTAVIYKETQEDWHPNFKIEGDQRYPDRNLVRVSVMQLLDKSYRCAVWGQDDFGMEYDSTDFNKVYRTYSLVATAPYIVKKELEEMGFVRA